MEVDLASVEVVFAQKLACGEPTTRQRALRILHDWIREQSTKKPFDEADLMRLCKGLHYVMWMQDKMLLQEELADRIGGLINIFNSEDEKVLYVKCFLKSLSKEWSSIDRWRMDKFLMAVRRMLRSCFAHLSDLKWKKETRDKYWAVFQETSMSSDKSFNEGLKLHFASLLLDELDNAGGLTKKQVVACLQPYITLLGVKEISEYLFSSIIEEVFEAIILQKSGEVQAAEEGEELPKAGIEFNYKEISKLVFDVGKKPEVNGKRRSKIYALVKKLEKCAADQDPLYFEVPVPKEVLKPEDFDKATERFVKMNEDVKEERLNAKKMKKLIRQKAREEEAAAAQIMEVDDDLNGDGSEGVEEVKKKGAKGKKLVVPKVKKAKRAKHVQAKGVGKKMRSMK